MAGATDILPVTTGGAPVPEGDEGTRGISVVGGAVEGRERSCQERGYEHQYPECLIKYA